MKHVATKPPRRLGTRLGDLLLTLLAIAGSICIILMVLGFFFNVSIMMFRTGSMSPTIDTGSIALVRQIPAAQMNVGDIVTVERGDGLLPVTHRVLDISHVDARTGEVTFTMQGDANDTPDPLPYSVTTVREVMFSVPGVAPVVQSLGNPLVLGGLTVAASALVVWAFWPRAEETDEVGVEPPGRMSALAVPLVLGLGLTTGLPDGTAAAGHTQHIEGEVLQLRSTTFPEAMDNMAPGDAATWVVDAWAETAEAGRIHIALGASGELAQRSGALVVDVSSCPIAVDGEQAFRCLAEPETLASDLDTASLVSSRQAPAIASFPTDEAQRFLITASLDNAVAGQGTSAILRLKASGAGDEVEVGPPVPDPTEQLPRTGSDGAPALLWTAAGLLVVGAALARGIRRTSGRN